MNYRHAFHAGNFADVVKHVVLARAIEHLRAKPAPFRVIDTHAGIGLYDLGSQEARRTGEWRQGVGRLLHLRGPDDVEQVLAPWRKALAAANPGGEVVSYPGSPVVALHGMRADDRLIACELHPLDREHLAGALAGDRRAKVLGLDGWQALQAFVPPKERRGLVLVDPPFEKPGEFDRLADGLAQAHSRWPQGIYLLWYAIKDEREVERLRDRLVALARPRTWLAELRVLPSDGRFAGCGLALVNPPWKLPAELALVLPWLARHLGQEGPGQAAVTEIVPETADPS